MKLMLICSLSLCLGVGICGTSQHCDAATPVDLQIVGPWELQVTLPAAGVRPQLTEKLTITPPAEQSVVDEQHPELPVFQENAPSYAKGIRLHAIIAEGLTAPDLLDPASVVVRTGAGQSGEVMERGRDYEFEPRWGGLGRLPEGRIPAGTPVWISYRYTLQRLDSLVLTAAGKLELRPGVEKATLATAPDLQPGEQRLANIWWTRPVSQLQEQQLFPILESTYPEPEPTTPSVAEERLPRTLAKLRAGEPVRILAWGDSVTEGAYLSAPEQERWQEQFVARLRKRFPQAKIELITEAWGGRNTDSYLGVPPGEPHNYQERVLATRPDLIISEFVNDAWMNPEQVEAKYPRFLQDFQNIGAEWVILTPHYVRPDWMGLDREQNVDDDPRPYVQGLRQFSQKHNVALADAALRYGRLWRQGIPHNSLMINCINHPDPRGLKIFADALMPLFPEK